MELEEPINANDEKDVCDNNDVEVIRRVLDEMIERFFFSSAYFYLKYFRNDSKAFDPTMITHKIL
ncbi:unnamed protein product [Wuchereria bancrofti]|uniref:Uncharacterized protein n=1 Tax=Wuchereria bancrofti TaxID=6293 RepID=A0A3P7FRC5_WUCBA|nr:unnamed protein product [Wuchereria bancrofti]